MAHNMHVHICVDVIANLSNTHMQVPYSIDILHVLYQSITSTTQACILLNMDNDPIDSAFQSRRFAHGKSKGKSGRASGRSGGASKPFNPLTALGSYEVSLGAGPSSTQHVLEIHELSEEETGLLGTFDFGKLRGMFAMAGSRKQLVDIVAGLEEGNDDDDDDDDDSTGADDDGKDSHKSQSDDDDEEEETEQQPSAIELQDEKVNRRARAFEKNSFRNPKFWIRWKGTPVSEASDDSEPNRVETDMGYLVFANNECDKFDGTINCPSLDWKQLKLKGRKIHSKGRSCPADWNDMG
jgi:hypothetical protein